MQTYPCPRCDHDPFLMHSTLIEHLKTRHRLEPHEIDALSDTPPAEFVCDLCGRTFPKAQGLSMHKTRSHGNAAPELDVVDDQGHDIEQTVVEETILIDAERHEALTVEAWALGYSDLREYLGACVALLPIDSTISKIMKLRREYLEVTA